MSFRFFEAASLGLCLSLLSACGTSVNKDPVGASAQVQEEVTSAGFSVEKNVAVSAVAAPEGVSDEGKLVSTSDKIVNLPKGTELSVLETRYDAKLGELMHLGIDSDDESLPADMWVKATPELKAALAQNIMPTEITNSDEGEDSLVTVARKGMTYCYRYVKQYLIKTGKVKVYLPGNSAWMASRELPKHGFRLTGHSPATAANGEVCVYRGGPRGHGHIEVKINGKWWYGYGYIGHPIRNRVFIGCYAK